MENRLELLRTEIDKLIFKENHAHYDIRKCISHMYGVAFFCTVLAKKRNMNVELATTCGMLHDICWMTGRGGDDHAVKGAEQAKEILKTMNIYSDDEINIVTAAMSKHSDKSMVNEPYDELLKDADVMAHCFYNADFPIADWEMARYKNLLAEFGLPPA